MRIEKKNIAGRKDSMELKNRDSQKAHLWPLYIPNSKFLAQFGGELCEEQTQKKRKKIRPKHPTFGAEREVE